MKYNRHTESPFPAHGVRRRAGRMLGYPLVEKRLCAGDGDGKVGYCVFYPMISGAGDAADNFNAFCERVARAFFTFAEKKAAAQSGSPFCAVCVLSVEADDAERSFRFTCHSYYGDPENISHEHTKVYRVRLPDFSFIRDRDLTKVGKKTIL